MKKSRRTIVFFCGILAFTAVVHADMMPVSHEDDVHWQSPRCCIWADIQDKSVSGISNCTCIANLEEWSGELLSETYALIGQTPEIQQLKCLTDGTNSLELCLSALISLGLCCSAHWVKRLSLGFVPEWYHEGGPFQIGHSQVLLPGIICPEPAICFNQPSCTGNNYLPQYFFKTVISIWRKSQFTPAVIASRGPPILS